MLNGSEGHFQRTTTVRGGVRSTEVAVRRRLVLLLMMVMMMVVVVMVMVVVLLLLLLPLDDHLLQLRLLQHIRQLVVVVKVNHGMLRNISKDTCKKKVGRGRVGRRGGCVTGGTCTPLGRLYKINVFQKQKPKRRKMRDGNCKNIR